MLQYTAEAFFWCGRALRHVQGDISLAAMVVRDGEPVLDFSLAVDDEAKQKALAHLASVEKECRKVGMTITAETAQEVFDELEGRHGRSRFSYEWLHAKIEMIERLAEKELKGRTFLYVPPERAKYWPLAKQPNLFGEDVASKFPSAFFDITCSGQCLATGMSTAAVFHLMRVMEVGLGVLGAVFGVSLARTNWAPALTEIENKIRNMHTDAAWRVMPDWKDQQEFYARAAIHFAMIKDAWRNHTIHGREKYVHEEAERIFDSVKAFMQTLAAKLSE